MSTVRFRRACENFASPGDNVGLNIEGFDQINVDYVIAGRVEQGVVMPGEEVVFLPTHNGSYPCAGRVSTFELHHTRADFASPGDNVGLNIEGFDQINVDYVIAGSVE